MPSETLVYPPLRGMIAPASLKQSQRSEGHQLARIATPGHDCPGLIEAEPDSQHDARAARPLRGMIAPASLKLSLTLAVVLSIGGPLRGMIAPASLKRRRQWRRRRSGEPHSGA